jgi:hypothetical protein
VPTRVTPGVHRHPIWWPEGDFIFSLFQGRGIGTFDRVTTSVATGDVETRQQGAEMVKPMGWSPHGIWDLEELYDLSTIPRKCGTWRSIPRTRRRCGR